MGSPLRLIVGSDVAEPTARAHRSYSREEFIGLVMLYLGEPTRSWKAPLHGTSDNESQ